jgi:hypothetical protein
MEIMNYSKVSMNNKKLSKFFIIFGLLLFVLSIVSFLYPMTDLHIKAEEVKKNNRKDYSDHSNEEYEYGIANIKSLKEFKDTIRSEVIKRKLKGIEIPILIDDYIRNKFYSAGSFIEWHENWFLYLLDFIFPRLFFSTSMVPDDIIKYDYAMCSQSSIVFQEVVKDYGFDYASVRFFIPDFLHFSLAVKVDGEWYYFDSNMEPKYDRTDPGIYDGVVSADKNTLENLYPDERNNNISAFNDVNKSMITASEINTFPAKNGVLVQKISYFISWYGWIIFIVIGFIIYRYNNKKNIKK